MMLLLIWLPVLAAALYLYLRRVYSTFSSKGVKTPPPTPIYGNMTKVLLKREHFVDHVNRFYFDFVGERFVGRYEFLTPTVVIRDLELIKRIAIKDFDHFVDRRMTLNEKIDPLFGRSLFSMKGQVWRDMRSTLSPAFTSSKIRLMVPFMVEVGEQMIKALTHKIQASENGFIDIEVKDLTSRYANDVIASCAFGLKVDSHMDENNEFYATGKATSTITFKQMLISFGYMAVPKIMEFLEVSLYSASTKNFFRNLVMDTMKEREQKHIIRPDMIHLLMEAKKGKLNHEEKQSKDADAGFATVEESNEGKQYVNKVWTDDDIVAQAILFFVAGFDTVSTAMSFFLHEMAIHLDIQERLVKEIWENDRNNNGKLDYNSLQKMVYLDMVVSEVLRLWPAAIALDRVCLRDYNLGRPNDTATEDFILHRGKGIYIPLWSIHRDPEFFPDPLKFDPERFSEQNKHKIQPFTYMPFGLGPRNCIGSRFALCEMKVMAYQLLQHMEVSPCENTCIPAQLDPSTFSLKMKGGHWIRFNIRKRERKID